MVTPPENTTERLNRELARLRMRDVGFWGGWALLIGTLGFFAFFWLNVPQDARFVTGTAGATMPLMSEEGANLTMRVTVEGLQRDIRLPSQLVHPAPGEAVCLRAAKHRFTGHTSYVIVHESRCDGSDSPDATPDVE